MRQRKAKDLENRLKQCSRYMIESPFTDGLREYFNDKRDLFVEIGCGKGNFIIKKALDNPDKDFIAIEGQETVILRALEKVRDMQSKGTEIKNLKFMPIFIDYMSDIFPKDCICGIYLNFSDPWPKDRHAKRRLTYRKRLMDYANVLREDGFIEFKTDNDELFEFSLGEINVCKGIIKECTRDLHDSLYDSRNTTTEYEEKFRAKGKNINYVKFLIPKNILKTEESEP